MWLADQWKDYEVIDCSQGEKLERWGDYLLVRPDPQVVWKSAEKSPLWQKADAVYHRSEKGGGQWEYRRRLPEKCLIPREGGVSSKSHTPPSPRTFLPTRFILSATLGFEIRFDAPTLVDETTAIVAPPPKKEREHDMFRDFLVIRNHFYLHPIVFAVTFFPQHRTTLRSRFLGDGGLS